MALFSEAASPPSDEEGEGFFPSLYEDHGGLQASPPREAAFPATLPPDSNTCLEPAMSALQTTLLFPDAALQLPPSDACAPAKAQINTSPLQTPFEPLVAPAAPAASVAPPATPPPLSRAAATRNEEAPSPAKVDQTPRFRAVASSRRHVPTGPKWTPAGACGAYFPSTPPPLPPTGRGQNRTSCFTGGIPARGRKVAETQVVHAACQREGSRALAKMIVAAAVARACGCPVASARTEKKDLNSAIAPTRTNAACKAPLQQRRSLGRTHPREVVSATMSRVGRRNGCANALSDDMSSCAGTVASSGASSCWTLSGGSNAPVDFSPGQRKLELSVGVGSCTIKDWVAHLRA
eukprot:TRINITY_DN37724_c0_g1_i1.p1 TRINITY_DN37724_c0_g1~~TRINITY_DN37724_c0_g1_i1.p1  ORF type:complete len:350 (-),score=60.58 TRINITY_DN37724_c0_g1_i1:57-1106(-)